MEVMKKLNDMGMVDDVFMEKLLNGGAEKALAEAARKVTEDTRQMRNYKNTAGASVSGGNTKRVTAVVRKQKRKRQKAARCKNR